ncbi:putative apyrase 6 [Camellia lanceoleosa]|nr:putative apyrase 6 [Camellia lanceoleosa]
MQVNPGLSAYSDDPDGAGRSLEELVEFGKKRVPKGIGNSALTLESSSYMNSSVNDPYILSFQNAAFDLMRNHLLQEPPESDLTWVSRYGLTYPIASAQFIYLGRFSIVLPQLPGT